MANQSTVQRQKTSTAFSRGLAQHSLVEHSLCLLNSRRSLTPGAKHVVSYDFTDKNRNRKTATATISAANGLNANDEMLLNGLLSLTFSQPDASLDFYATPYWCMKQLGIVDKDRTQGYRFTQFKDALHRLAGVTYSNDRFYDPVRGEHREVIFGLLKYSLPLGNSSRAWRLIWDPQFFRNCETIKGSFQFDFDVYRKLDPASRRLFLLLNKIFHRNDTSPRFDVRSLAVNTLGYSSDMRTSDLKQKLLRSSRKMHDLGVIATPDCMTLQQTISKKRPGEFAICFHKGANTGLSNSANQKPVESPLAEPLTLLGFEALAVNRILKGHSRSSIQQWIDITQAAVERDQIKTTPQAFFMYYIKEAKAKRTTPPDWWRELKKQEFEKRQSSTTKSTSSCANETFAKFLADEGKAAFEKTTADIFETCKRAGQDAGTAHSNAVQHARTVARREFNQQNKHLANNSVSSFQDILRSRFKQ